MKTYDFDHIVCISRLGGQFNFSQMACVRTRQGQYINFLFDACGEPLPLQSKTAMSVAAYFEKTFTNFDLLLW